MTAFIGSFLQYLVIFVILIAVAVLGVFAGMTWRKHTDAKKLSGAGAEQEDK